MDKDACRVVRTESEWKEIVEEQTRLGISGVRFCRARNIDYNQYLYHRRKILRKSNRQLTPASPTRIVPVSGTGGFIPITVEEGPGVRLRFPRGMVLEANRLPPASWVVEVAQRWMRMESC